MTTTTKIQARKILAEIGRYDFEDLIGGLRHLTSTTRLKADHEAAEEAREATRIARQHGYEYAEDLIADGRELLYGR